MSIRESFRLAALFSCFLFLMIPLESKSADFNNTLTHFYLTSAQNLELELQKAVILKSSLQSQDTEEESGTLLLHLAHLIQSKGQKETYGFGMLGYISPSFDVAPLKIQVFGGVTSLYFIENSDKGWDWQTIFLNMLLGTKLSLNDWVTLNTGLSINAGLTKASGRESIGFDFDQFSATIESPITGLFGKSRIDLGMNQVRDIEGGWNINLREYGWGRLSIAYTQRFDYAITGTILRDDEDTVIDVLADFGGRITWNEVSPWDGALIVGVDIALTSVPGLVRIAAGEIGYRFLNQGDGTIDCFIRGGTAFSRLLGQNEFGGAIGLSFNTTGDKVMSLKLSVGRNDPGVVDRFGDVGKFVVALRFVTNLI
jgi:hypothetical protein